MTHEKIQNSGAVLPLMFTEPISAPSSMLSPGDARDSSMTCLQVAPELEGRQRDEQKLTVRHAWVPMTNTNGGSKSVDGCCADSLSAGKLSHRHCI